MVESQECQAREEQLYISVVGCVVLSAPNTSYAIYFGLLPVLLPTRGFVTHESTFCLMLRYDFPTSIYQSCIYHINPCDKRNRLIIFT